MKKDVFISYRRDGGDSLAQLMYYRLTNDGYNVFLDVESLRSGKFNEALYQKIEECTDFILILPEKGLDRCVDPSDWVRLEIECALRLNKNIIPIMMRNFKFPDNLPESIRDVADYNGLESHQGYFDSLIEKLETNLMISKPQNMQTDEKEQESKANDNNKPKCPKCGSLKCKPYDDVDIKIAAYNGISHIMSFLATVAAYILIISIGAYFLLGIQSVTDFVYTTLIQKLSVLQTLPDIEKLRGQIIIIGIIDIAFMLISAVTTSVCDNMSKKLYRKEVEKGKRSVLCKCDDCAEEFYFDIEPQMLVKRNKKEDSVVAIIVVLAIISFLVIGYFFMPISIILIGLVAIALVVVAIRYMSTLRKTGNREKAKQEAVKEIKELFK